MNNIPTDWRYYNSAVAKRATAVDAPPWKINWPSVLSGFVTGAIITLLLVAGLNKNDSKPMIASTAVATQQIPVLRIHPDDLARLERGTVSNVGPSSSRVLAAPPPTASVEGANIISRYTQFHSVDYSGLQVVTGWNFDSNTQDRPSSQYCYLFWNDNGDGSSRRITIANDRMPVPNKPEWRLGTLYDEGLKRCVWHGSPPRSPAANQMRRQQSSATIPGRHVVPSYAREFVEHDEKYNALITTRWGYGSPAREGDPIEQHCFWSSANAPWERINIATNGVGLTWDSKSRISKEAWENVQRLCFWQK